jgi:hypothetical protein
MTLRILSLFFAGAFLCNALPHLASGLRGEIFPTPFAKPPGRGPSSPLVNFLWGLFNLVVGAQMLGLYSVTIGPNIGFLAVVLGALALGVYLSRHFENWRG